MNSSEDVEKQSDKDIPTLEAPKKLEPVVGLDENFKKSHLKIIIYPLLSKNKLGRDPSFYLKIYTYNTLSARFRIFTTNSDKTEILRNIQEAMKSPKWKETVMEKMKALRKNET